MLLHPGAWISESQQQQALLSCKWAFLTWWQRWPLAASDLPATTLTRPVEKQTSLLSDRPHSCTGAHGPDLGHGWPHLNSRDGISPRWLMCFPNYILNRQKYIYSYILRSRGLTPTLCSPGRFQVKVPSHCSLKFLSHAAILPGQIWGNP